MMPGRFPRRWLLLALLLPVLLHAAAAVPKLARHVTDLTGTLSAQQVDQLDAQLVALEQAKGAQLVVLMVGSTGEQDIESYSLAVAEANKVGRKGTDDGVLLLIAKDDRHVRIEVGYGLEGAIPDAATARIIREYIAPKFRSNDYFGGISDAVGALTQLINGEALPPPVQGAPERGRPGLDLQSGLMIAVFVALFLRGIFGRTPALVRGPLGAVLVGGLLWLLISMGAGILGALVGGVLMLLPGGAGRSIGGGGWGGFGGGGWGGGSGGGSFGGGGFSGGGGSFGGGGSSGSW
ncbi:MULTISPECIES: TPM domain-containing protein [Rhodanobacter]|uniref:TPM domain-containing protein n=1 Tax=Rhodanobacter TaxID=75309 RepID=UPI00040A271B|nr:MULTISPECIES: TPM domain-containing protein [Rhodanobacter]KZC20676.1 dehydrogenase [Rhodanobacter denitrificans]UJJ51953.1 TPM domain-containing protein [Rhodanobacter denitrificans]UJJ59269.1 TPM domain-containing protein [Rhodanobacter denitrificans]UJM94697.1 TPM domain-containing protein [Rhodanobacter denitrificans]UJM98227.1 TPM domain-containing protein [Rhodanobacter denitrificans]